MQDTILVRIETSPEDINGMHAAKGILTARGGMTSHAAVVARGMGKPCVSGSSEIKIDYEKKIFKSGEYQIKEGDYVGLTHVGAYGMSLSSNYNTRPAIAEILVTGSKHKLIKKRQSLENLVSN